MPALLTDLLLIERGGISYQATAGEVAGLGARAGQIVLTVPNNALEATATISAPGVTPSDILLICIAPHLADDENDAELIDLAGLSATPDTDQITVTASFLTRHAGPIRLNWSAF